MTNEEKQEIVNEVLAALQTHGKTIGQLTPVISPSDSDTFELSGGRNLSYGKLKDLITAIFTAALNGYVPADALWKYIQQYVAKLGTNGALDWQESPVVMLATMGTTYDNVDGELPAYTLQEGDMYYQYGVNFQIFRRLANGGGEGLPAKEGVVYFNMRTWRTYKWTGSTMVEIAKVGTRVINDLTTGGEGDALSAEMGKVLKGLIDNIGTGRFSIVDEHDNNSVLLAPSARQMKLMYNNIMAIYNGLANIAFTDGKPSLDWVGSKTKYTLSYGTLTGCRADVAAGQVNEGALRIKLTPTQASYAFTSVTVNGQSAQTTATGDADGSVYLDIVVNGNITVAATAISGRGITFNGTGCSIGAAGVAIGHDLDTTITANEHFTLPASITVKIGNANVTHTYTRAQDNKTATLHIDAANITGDLTITCTAVEEAHVTIAISGSKFVVKQGNTQLPNGSKVYNGSAAQTLTIEPASGYKFSTLPSADKGTMTNNGPYEASSLEIGTSVSGTLTITAAGSALQTFSIDLSGLVGVTSSNAATSILEGSPYSTTLSKTDSSASGSVIIGTCTMGSENIAPQSGNTINVEHVTGNIVIAASIGVARAKVHSWGYEPSTDGDGKHYLADSVGDFWLYSKADAGLGVCFPNDCYGNIRSGKDEASVIGYGAHRTLDALVAGEDFTLRIKHLGIVLSSNGVAYNSLQKSIKLFKSNNVKYTAGQFDIGYNSNNGRGYGDNMSILLRYGTGTEERQVIFDDVKTPIKTQDNYDYYLVFVSSTKTATVYRVKNDGSSVDVCGEKVVEKDLCSDLIAYIPSEDYLQGLDVYNYAMDKSAIETLYGITNNG